MVKDCFQMSRPIGFRADVNVYVDEVGYQDQVSEPIGSRIKDEVLGSRDPWLVVGSEKEIVEDQARSRGSTSVCISRRGSKSNATKNVVLVRQNNLIKLTCSRRDFYFYILRTILI
jgi:hypothetical protein